jgi:hypothetical protein
MINRCQSGPGKVGLPQGPERGVARGDPAGPPRLHAVTSVAEVYAVVVPAVAKTRDDIAGLQRIIAVKTKAEGDR